MYLKKIVESTVDKMTLSYTERHLKEAMDQEHGIPTTVLAVIADKSYNEHNMKSIAVFLEKCFKSNLKEWKKCRNLLKIIEYLLKFAAPDFVTFIKRFQGEIRMLQNFSFTESGIDRAAVIRESASLILLMLSNPRDLEVAREEGRRLREKYQGISSDPQENQGRYEGYSSGSYSGVSNERQYEGYSNSYKGSNDYDRGYPKSNENNRKIAESLFGGVSAAERTEYSQPEYKQPEYRSDLFNTKTPTGDNFYESGKIYEKPQKPDIFSVNAGRITEETVARTDLFANVQRKDVKRESYRNEETKGPDLFSVNLGRSSNFRPEAQNIDLLEGNDRGRDLLETDNKPNFLYAQASEKPNLFSNLSEKTNSRPGATGDKQNLFARLNEKSRESVSPTKFEHIPTNKVPDLFAVNEKPKDLFQQNSNPNPFPPKKAVGFSDPSTGGIDLLGHSERSDLFAPTPVPAKEIQPGLQVPHDLFGLNPHHGSLIPQENPIISYPSQPNPGVLLTDLQVPGASSYAKPLQFDIFAAKPVQSSEFLSQPVFSKPAEPPQPLLTQKAQAFPDSKPAQASLFSGMTQKKFQSEPEPSQSLPHSSLTALESLNLNFSYPEQTAKPKATSQAPNAKYKFNLSQSETSKVPSQKALNPAEFEAQLFNF